MITGRKKILDWFDAKPDFPYWALYYRGKTSSGQPIARMRDTDGIAKREGYDELDKHLNLISRGSYTLVAMPKAQIAARGAESVDFEIVEGAAVGSTYDGSTPQPAVVQGFTQADVDRQVTTAIDAAMAKYKAEVEMENLRKQLAESQRELKELQQSHDDPWNKIAGVVAPHLPGLLGLQQPGVAGLPIPAPTTIHHQTTTEMDNQNEVGSTIQTDTTVQLSDADNERLGEILGGFAEIDPDWINTLDRMVKKGKSNPSLINLLKSML